jgi:hypothetical protein
MAFFRVVGWGTNVWYYLPMLTIVALAIDTALDSEHLAKAAALWRSTTAIVALAITAPLLLKASEIRATNLDYVANLVAKHATPDDLVVVWPGSDGITFNRYFDHRVPWITIPKAPNLPAQPGDDILAPFREPNSLRPTLAQVEATLRNGGRVWLASTWPLEIPEGQPRPVLPLEKNNPRSVGYFLRGWGHLLAVQMRLHAKETYRVALPQDQPVSVYEHSHVTVFAGWK